MATDAWKKHSLQNSESRDYHHNTDYYFSNGKQTNNFHQRIRETGVIEKLCQTYGFIECAEQELRVFFHYSQYKGNANELETGDNVEFEVSSDTRTGKPIACRVLKLEPGTVTFEVKSEERVVGKVEVEAKPPRFSYPKQSSSRNGDSEAGRVCYEVNGESFFLPYYHSDVISNSQLYKGDSVSFFTLENKRNGHHCAVELLLVKAAPPVYVQGIVCSLKESFGFIERADKVNEIFFHYSEFQGGIGDLLLGDDVQFVVHARNGKEVAVSVEPLPEGTVKFEDISKDTFQGTVEKVFSRNKRQEPLNGKVLYSTNDGTSELPYGEKDVLGEFTILPGDVVGFKIATDRRDSLRRATEIYLIKEAESSNGGSVRERGFVSALKDGFGFIQCCDRDSRLFFHFSELIDLEQEINFSDEVEFSIVEDYVAGGRLHAIRVRILPRGSIGLKPMTEEWFTGIVERESAPWMGRSPRKVERERDSECGLIVACIENEKIALPFFPVDSDLRTMAKFGDQVEFQVSVSERTGHQMAVNVTVMKRNSDVKHLGFVAALKDTFGFIELADHEKDIFFRFIEYDGDLSLGDEVEFNITAKNGKVAAERLIKLASGTIPQETVISGTFEGRILRPLRRADPQQVDYQGLIEYMIETSDSESKDVEDDVVYVIPYGITGLVDKNTVLQCGEKVEFRIGCSETSDKQFAVEITAKRERLRAVVESVKGEYGFIAYETDEAKNLFFHTSEIEDDTISIKAGDTVEFSIIHNTRNGKQSACKISVVSERQRPERLVRRSLGLIGDDQSLKFTIIRQPAGPDSNTIGFNHQRALDLGNAVSNLSLTEQE
ncbi:cold shock domain-containing protein E1-like [Dendronephthya gigantea]|uniref:cold shock domain-containing protein E1-like n=1 Tax=Dendronephthya gigantea TaxID=151771 RepID=UPI00106CB367|nr:cold shock domain-containing protein E1-like [Dendronephthya gigantea]